MVAPTELLGRWRLHRRLADRRTGVIGQVAGHLQLERDGERIRWFEQGELQWDGRTIPVHRELQIVADGDAWLVCFADGRPFHPWRPGETVEHPCRADRYRGLVLIDRDRTRLRIGWDVAGPAKDQRILSRCYRQS